MELSYWTVYVVIHLVIIAQVSPTTVFSKTFHILPSARFSTMIRTVKHDGIGNVKECLIDYMGTQNTDTAMYCQSQKLCSIGKAPTDIVLHSATPDTDCNIYYHRIYGDWDYVFGAKNGTGMKVRETWTDTNYICENQSCVYLYKRRDVNDWTATNPSEVLQVYYDGSSPVAWLQFNASASTISDWFAEIRLMSASWTDMLTASHNKFCVVCGAGAHWRRFYISHSWAGCHADLHWVYVLENDKAPVCLYEQTTQYPVFIYSKIQTKTNFQTDPSTLGKAEWLTMYIK